MPFRSARVHVRLYVFLYEECVRSSYCTVVKITSKLLSSQRAKISCAESQPKGQTTMVVVVLLRTMCQT